MSAPPKPPTTLRRPGGGVPSAPAAAPPVEPPPAVREGFIRTGQGESVPPEVWEGPGRPRTSPDVSGRPESARAPQGSRVIVARKRAPSRRRTTVYFQLATAEQLAARCLAEGREVSAVVDDAVRAWLAGGRQGRR